MIKSSLSFLERAGKPGGGKGILVSEQRINCLATMLQPSVCYCLQGNGIERSLDAGCNGKGCSEGISYTLNTVDRHGVAYCKRQGTMEIGRTLCSTTGSYTQVEDEMSPTLMARDYKDPNVIVGENVKCNWDGSQVSPTLTANNAGGNQRMPDKDNFNAVIESFVDEYNSECLDHQQDTLHMQTGVMDTLCPGTHASGSHLTKTITRSGNKYIVRRLTPKECCRLQGFPDDWAVTSKKETLSDEEYHFWEDVRKTHCEIFGKEYKQFQPDKTLKWLNKLHTDSSEYKLWGNGICLPCAVDVLWRIVHAD